MVRCDAEVESILTKGDRAVGVRLTSGEEIRATRVLSNADPKRTFLGLCADADLPDDFVRDVEAYSCMGTSMKINLGLSALPHAKGQPSDGVQPYHGGHRRGEPVHRGDGPAAGAGGVRHRGRGLARRALLPDRPRPVAGAGGQAHRDDRRELPAVPPPRETPGTTSRTPAPIRSIAQLEQYFPGLSGLIEHRQVLSPLDMERVMGLTGGHALHGDMAPHQLLFMRPVRGWAKYRTPLKGLYLCGAGTHPGGGVTGANGRNAAREVLRDAKKRRAACVGSAAEPSCQRPRARPAVTRDAHSLSNDQTKLRGHAVGRTGVDDALDRRVVHRGACLERIRAVPSGTTG